MRKLNANRKGFTLIEMLIVIGIIGILAVGLGRLILGAPDRARDAQRKNAVASIVQALEAYNVDSGSYPGATAGEALCITGAADNAVENAIVNYFPGGQIPADPSGPTQIDGSNDCDFMYVKFASSVTNANYALYARAEEPTSGNADAYPANPTTTVAPPDVAATANTVYYVVQ